MKTLILVILVIWALVSIVCSIVSKTCVFFCNKSKERCQEHSNSLDLIAKIIDIVVTTTRCFIDFIALFFLIAAVLFYMKQVWA